MATAYLAHPDFRADLSDELARVGIRVERWHDRLAITHADAIDSVWATDIWPDTEELAVTSIADAAHQLRARGRNWIPFAPEHRGRANLIADRLPRVAARPLELGQAPPAGTLGSFTLLSPDRLLVAPACHSPFPLGEPRFVEDRAGPPNRAYLKLWEAFARLGRWPQAGERCLDLGASPGGWTWTLARLGASVEAIDKAPLDHVVAAMPGVRWRQGSAFADGIIDSVGATGGVDWVVSDVIAYPDRLYRMVMGWIDSGVTRHLICTVKLQGATDHAAVERFATIPQGRVMHLHHNKHELTFAALDLDR